MTTLVATLGFEPSAILPTVRACAVNRAVIFHYSEDDAGKGARAVRDTQKALTNIGVTVQMRELADGYDFAKTLDEILKEARQAILETPKGEEVVFDVTGGTKVMALACFTSAWLLGKRVVYNVETRESPTIPLPIEGLQDHATVGPQTERVLEILLAADPGPEGQPSIDPENLRKKFGAKSDSAINFHIDKLEQMRALRRVHGENLKQVRYAATPAAHVLHLALQARREAGPKLAPPKDRRRRR